jgi:hypothetical protein
VQTRPIHPVNERGELRCGQSHHPVADRRPPEGPVLNLSGTTVQNYHIDVVTEKYFPRLLKQIDQEVKKAYS